MEGRAVPRYLQMKVVFWMTLITLTSTGCGGGSSVAPTQVDALASPPAPTASPTPESFTLEQIQKLITSEGVNGAFGDINYEFGLFCAQNVLPLITNDDVDNVAYDPNYVSILSDENSDHYIAYIKSEKKDEYLAEMAATVIILEDDEPVLGHMLSITDDFFQLSDQGKLELLKHEFIHFGQINATIEYPRSRIPNFDALSAYDQFKLLEYSYDLLSEQRPEVDA